jgi:hypothetical protein
MIIRRGRGKEEVQSVRRFRGLVSVQGDLTSEIYTKVLLGVFIHFSFPAALQPPPSLPTPLISLSSSLAVSSGSRARFRLVRAGSRVVMGTPVLSNGSLLINAATNLNQILAVAGSRSCSQFDRCQSVRQTTRQHKEGWQKSKYRTTSAETAWIEISSARTVSGTRLDRCLDKALDICNGRLFFRQSPLSVSQRKPFHF